MEKVDILNTLFTSVFTKEDLNDIPEFNANYNGHCIINIQFSEKDIEEILKAIKVTKSPGPDNIHPRILNELANVLAKPLYLLFRKSIDKNYLLAGRMLTSLLFTDLVKNSYQKITDQ